MDVTDLCASLVKIRSENPPGDTREIISFIRDYCDSLGLKTRVIRNPGKRHNLVSFRPKGNLLFCGHVDVVPALKDGWSVDPNSGLVKEGSVWGRGATDMKGGCASILAACRFMVDEGEEVPADLAFVCDEETSGTYGVRDLLERGLIRPCDCIIAEPTLPTCPNIGQKGLLRFCCEFSGEPGHGSLYPVRGVSAVMEAYSFLNYLGEVHLRNYEPSESMREIISESSRRLDELFEMDGAGKVLTRIMFNPGKIEGGEKSNIVAQQCSLQVDLRIPWGCSIPDLTEDLRTHAPRGFITVTSTSDPSFTDPQSRIARTVLSEITRTWGIPASPIVQWAASDARYLRKAGYSVVEYGPGDVRTLHGIDEHVPVDSLKKAVEVYRGVMREYSRNKNL